MIRVVASELVEMLLEDRANYDKWVEHKNSEEGRRGMSAEEVEEMRHYQEQLKQEEGEARARWENSGMSVADYIRSRAEEGEPAFDLDWEMMRQLEHDQAQGMFQVNKEARFQIAPGAKNVSDKTKKEFAEDPISKRWIIRVEPEAFRRLAPRPIHVVAPVTDKLDNNSVRKAMERLFVDFGKVTNIDDGIIAIFNKKDAGKILMQSGVNMRIFAPQLKNLFETATLAFEGPQEAFPGHRFKTNVDLYKNYINKFIDLDGKEKYIRFTVRVENNKTRNGIHAATISDVALYENENAAGSLLGHNPAGTFREFTDDILSHYIRKGKGVNLENLRMDAQAQGTGKDVGRFQIERLYTGSAADYAERVPVLDKDGKVTDYRIDNKPSLLKIGTGEGSQVYGHGLYASSERGVAEYYSLGQESSLRIDGKSHYDSKEFQRGGKLSGVLNRLQNVVEWNVEKGLSAKEAVKEALNDSMWTKEERELLKPLEGRITHSKGNIYEQTWFTNRAKGDESHLLKWYEPVSEEQKKWIAATAKKEGFSGKLSEALPLTGEKAYGQLEYLLGSPKAASEFLARADIDGIKYPVGSYGQTVKDGDKVGWNYVSFRDDNIRVDHKWVDGVAKFGIAPSALGNGKQKYYEVPFEKAVDKIVKAGAPIGRDQVFVSETPKVFAKIGLTKLPIMMTQKHVLTICNDANTLSALGIKGNAHDMERVLKQIPRAIKNPLMIIASTTKAESSIVAITALKDKTGKTVIAPILLNGTSRTGSGWIDSHILTSAYGRDNTWSRLVVDALQDEAKGNVAVFYIDTTRANLIKNQLARVKKSGAMVLERLGQQLPRGQHRADFVHSIADPESPVKGAIVEQTETLQFKEWFKKSKIVDKDGKPLRVWHGTMNKFTVFDEAKTRWIG